jgi:hypothetical protein
VIVPLFFQRGIRGGYAWDFVFLYPLCLPLRTGGGRSNCNLIKQQAQMNIKLIVPLFFQRGIRGEYAWDFVFLYPLCLPLRTGGGRSNGVFKNYGGRSEKAFCKKDKHLKRER